MGVPQSSNEKQKLNKESVLNSKQLSAGVWFNAVYEGDLAVIERYLGSGWDVNAQDKYYGGGAYVVSVKTALHIAAEKGYIEILKLLLEHGADVNAKVLGFDDEKKFETEYTALHIAAGNGHIEIVKLLLEHGADVNFKLVNKIYGEVVYSATAVEIAKCDGHTKVFEFISQWLEQKLNLDPNN